MIVYQPVTPATVTYSPVVTPAPVTVYSPVIAPAPTVVYQPSVVATPAVTPYSPVVVTGRPVWVRTKVYVAGQPVRNFLRAITP